MKSLIIGYGEVGKSLWSVLSKQYFVDAIDKDDGPSEETYDILHVCFPYSDKFVAAVKEYQLQFKPKYTVIHSTVPPGTSEELEAVHSPTLGIHPNLGKSLSIFTKFLGGPQASEVADYFRRAGIKVYVVEKAKSTELMKILDTTFYATCIEYTKNVKEVCDKFKVPFELWTVYNQNYNEGYKKLGHEEFIRPNLTPIMTTQGGHCTIPNLEFIDTPFTKLVKELND